MVDSGLLRPFETLEYIRDFNSGYDYQIERDRMERELELAESALAAAQNGSGNRRGPRATRPLTVAEATARLEQAKAELELFKRRRTLTIGFKHKTSMFYDLKDELERQDCLLKWVLDEMPLVEAEVQKSEAGLEAVRDTPSAERDGEKLTLVSGKGARKRGREEVPGIGTVPPKRLKTAETQNTDHAGEPKSPDVPEPGSQSGARRRRNPPPPNPSPPVPPRRSARIAARQQAQAEIPPQPAALQPPVSGQPRHPTQARPLSKKRGVAAEPTTEPIQRTKKRRRRR